MCDVAIRREALYSSHAFKNSKVKRRTSTEKKGELTTRVVQIPIMSLAPYAKLFEKIGARTERGNRKYVTTSYRELRHTYIAVSVEFRIQIDKNFQVNK